jgi:hypothetical protein
MTMLRWLAPSMAVAATIVVCGQSTSPADAFFKRLRSGDDVAWLERVATSQPGLEQAWEGMGARGEAATSFRGEAYARLGAIGTSESLDAVHRIEAAAAGQRVLARDLTADAKWPHPAVWMSDSALQASNVVGIGARQYAPMVSDMYGPYGPYVRISEAGSRVWSRPVLAGPPVEQAWLFDGGLATNPDGLRFLFTPRGGASIGAPPPVDIPLDRISRDSDGDGWTDFEETTLGMNPRAADSDGDGLRDDVDDCPLYSPPLAETRDEDAQILRRAMFAMFGLRGSRYVIFGQPGSRPVQLFGFAGPVIFDRALPNRLTSNGRGAIPADAMIRGGMQAAWQIARRPDDVIVHITNWATSQFRSAADVTLRRINGEWIVVEIGLRSVT